MVGDKGPVRLACQGERGMSSLSANSTQEGPQADGVPLVPTRRAGCSRRGRSCQAWFSVAECSVTSVGHLFLSQLAVCPATPAPV